MIKGKTGFWLLVILFSALTFSLVLGGGINGQIMTEMDGTMGSMMKKGHASGTTLNDIIASALERPIPHHESTISGAGHHQLPAVIKALDLGGAAAILLMLPLMVGASIVLVIIWI